MQGSQFSGRGINVGVHCASGCFRIAVTVKANIVKICNLQNKWDTDVHVRWRKKRSRPLVCIANLSNMCIFSEAQGGSSRIEQPQIL